MNKRVAELFAGIGLMRMGLERGGWDTVWANDIDQKKGEMYRTHYGEGSDDFVIGDVHAVAVSAMPDVELATASFHVATFPWRGAAMDWPERTPPHSGDSSGCFAAWANAGRPSCCWRMSPAS